MKKKLFLFSAILILFLLIFFVVYSHYKNNISNSLQVNDTCKDIVPEENTVCPIDGGECTTSKNYYARDLCYESLAEKNKQVSFCLNITSDSKDRVPNQKSCESGISLILNLSIQSKNENFTHLAYSIGKGNYYVLSDDKDQLCPPYLYFNQGCYYSSSKYYLTASSLQGYGLADTEIDYLCYKFVLPGGVAYCLKSNNKINECLAYANNDSYLIQICNLKDNETID